MELLSLGNLFGSAEQSADKAAPNAAGLDWLIQNEQQVSSTSIIQEERPDTEREL